MNVSVVIPNFNGARTIVRTIQSVLDQVPAGSEVIVADDGSTDGSVALIESTFDGVRVVRSEGHQGVAVMRNRCLTLAQGTWLLFIDSDVILQPGAFDLMYRAAAQSDITFPTIVYANGEVMYPTGEAHSRYLLITPIFLLRRSAVLSAQPPLLFDETFLYRSEDTDFFLRAYLAGITCAYVPEALALHDVNLEPRDNAGKYYLEVRNSIYGALKFRGLRSIGVLDHSFKPSNIVRVMVCGLFNYNLFDMQARGAQKQQGLRYSLGLLFGSHEKLTSRGSAILVWLTLKAIAWNVAHLSQSLRAGREMRRDLATETRPTLTAAHPS